MVKKSVLVQYHNYGHFKAMTHRVGKCFVPFCSSCNGEAGHVLLYSIIPGLVLGYYLQFWYISSLRFGVPIEIVIMFPFAVGCFFFLFCFLFLQWFSLFIRTC